MRKCTQCDQEFETVLQLANHTRWQHKRTDSQVKCRWCGRQLEAPNVRQHEESCQGRRPCQNCGEPTRSKFCSRRCSAIVNNRLGKTGYAAHRRNNGIVKAKTYCDICFEHWSEACALCGWSVSVDVHHIDNDRSNNRPDNLIPLCQNHHILTRMVEHRDDIDRQIHALIKEKFVTS